MRKIVLSAALMLLILQGFSKAQTPETADKPDNWQANKLRFGFNAGVQYSNLQVSKTNQGSLNGVQISNGLGLRLGIIMDYALSSHWSISPKAELAFNNSRVSVTQPDASKLTYEVYPVIMELSTHVVYKLKGEKIRPYMMLGPNFKLPFLDSKNTSPQITKSDVAIDIGLGADKMFTHFNFAPELRYSCGLMNISNDNAIQRMNFHTVAVVFNFM